MCYVYLFVVYLCYVLMIKFSLLFWYLNICNIWQLKSSLELDADVGFE